MSRQRKSRSRSKRRTKRIRRRTKKRRTKRGTRKRLKGGSAVSNVDDFVGRRARAREEKLREKKQQNLEKFSALVPHGGVTPEDEGELRRSSSEPGKYNVHRFNKYIDAHVEKLSMMNPKRRQEESDSPTPDFRVRMYNFPIDVCTELKAHSILDQYIPDRLKEYKKNIPSVTSVRGTPDLLPYTDSRMAFNHLNWRKRAEHNRKGHGKRGDWKAVKDFKDHIDLNSLMIVSHALAEKFAKDSGFGAGKYILDTELVETHYYFINWEGEKVSGAFGKHVDDGASVEYKTITVIWYLKKSPDLEDGNISFHLGPNAKEESSHVIRINVGSGDNTCNCLLFAGDIWHMSEDMSGKGERSSVVFHFERKNENIFPPPPRRYNADGQSVSEKKWVASEQIESKSLKDRQKIAEAELRRVAGK